jgi:hypothetical protein
MSGWLPRDYAVAVAEDAERFEVGVSVPGGGVLRCERPTVLSERVWLALVAMAWRHAKGQQVARVNR